MLSADTLDRHAHDKSGAIVPVTIVVWDDDNDQGLARLPDLNLVSVSLVGRTLHINEEPIDWHPLENEVIVHMRACIAAMDTDQAVVRDEKWAAHELFGVLVSEWPEPFAILYNSMLEIYRAKTPPERGHFRARHVEIGFTGYETKSWIKDKVQPPRPTSTELLERFDQLIGAYRSKESL